MLFSVSIVVHNRLDLTRKCLESVIAHSPPKRTEILIWDNASTDGTFEYLQVLALNHPNIQLWRSDENIGFLRPQNFNCSQAKGTYFVGLNNDVEVCHGWLQTMRKEFLTDPQLALCGIKGGCSQLRSDGMGQPGPAVEYVEGACFMIPSWLARREALFSEEFRFAYCEDVDLSLRLRRKGYHVKLLGLPIKHLRGQTVSEIKREREGPDVKGYHAMNHVILRRKWGGYLTRRSFAERILIERDGALGDVLMLTPIIRALKQQNSEAYISVYTKCGAVLENNPDLGEVQAWRYDSSCKLDGVYELEPRKHIIEAYAEAAGLDPLAIDWRLRMYPSKADREYATSFAENIGKPYAVIHTGTTAWPGRNWSPVKFKDIAKRLMVSGWGIVQVGNHATPSLNIPDVPMLSVEPLKAYAVMERAGLFVGIDSFPLHLAQAALIPAVGIFGLIDPKYRLLPFPFIRGAVHPNLGCLGCHHEQPAPQTTGKCFREREFCMDDLSVDVVWSEIEKALEAIKVYQEASKIRERIIQYLPGDNGIDIGCGKDKIKPGCVGYDDDAAPGVDMVGDVRNIIVDDGKFDWVFSSHCLEDLADTEGALREWLRVLKPGANIVLYVPHPDLYKGVNLDHKYPGFLPGELAGMLENLGCFVLEAFVDDGPDRYSTCVVARKK